MVSPPRAVRRTNCRLPAVDLAQRLRCRLLLSGRCVGAGLQPPAACQEGRSVGSTTAAVLVHDLMEAGDVRRVGEAVQEPANDPFRPGGGQRHKVHILEMNGDSYRLKGRRQSAAALAPASDRPAAD